MMNDSILMSVSSVFSSGVGAVGTIALLIVSMTLVRKVDERAGWLLAGGFAIFLGLSILWPVASFLIPHITDEFTIAYAAVSILFTIVRIGGLVLEVLGIVVLAQTAAKLKAQSA